MLQSLECVRIDLNDLKTVISISMTKNAPDAPQLWNRTNCEKMRKNHGKRWKILRLIYIVLYCINFFIIIKKIAKNRQELLHRPNK